MVQPLERAGGCKGHDRAYQTGAWKFLECVKGVRSSVFECRIDFGPGYRVYFGQDGERVVILLGGGIKRRQQKDIDTAIVRWQDYKERKLKR